MKEDKKKHVIAGIIIAITGWLITKYKKLSIWWALLPIVLIGGGKELIWDKWMAKGVCEWLDFVYTMGAGILIVVIIWLINYVKKN